MIGLLNLIQWSIGSNVAAPKRNCLPLVSEVNGEPENIRQNVLKALVFIK